MSKLNSRCGGPLFVCTKWLTCIGVCRALDNLLHRRPRAVRFRNEGLVRVEPPPLRRHLPPLVARQGKNHAPSCASSAFVGECTGLEIAHELARESDTALS